MKTAIRRITTSVDSYRMLFHWCPACECAHGVRIDDGRPTDRPKWTWDGDKERPTLSPSILNFTTYDDEKDDADGRPLKLPAGQRRTLCHYFLKAGVIEYCSDNPHALNGKSVPLTDIPADYGIGGGDDDG